MSQPITPKPSEYDRFCSTCEGTGEVRVEIPNDDFPKPKDADAAITLWGSVIAWLVPCKKCKGEGIIYHER